MRIFGILFLTAITAGAVYLGYHYLVENNQEQAAPADKGAAKADAKAGGPPAGGPPMGVPVEAMTVQPEQFVSTITAVGTLMADEAITVRPEVAGKIDRIPVQEGQEVKKGQLLFGLDEKLMRAERNEAAAQAAQARLQADRLLKVTVEGAISAGERDVAKQSKLAAAATLGAAEERLAKSQIKAPFDGVVGLRQVSPGEVVEIGKPLTTLQKLDPIKVEFTVPEKDAMVLKDGQDLEFTLPDQPDASYHAKVYAFEPGITQQGRFVTVRAKTGNADHKLRPGSYVNIQLVTAQKEGALLVPEQAIIPMGNQTMVMTIVEGKVVPAPVQVGARLQGKAEITSGLKAGDQVMTAGFMKAMPGAPVTIMPSGADTAKPASNVTTAPTAGDAQPAADAMAPANDNQHAANNVPATPAGPAAPADSTAAPDTGKQYEAGTAKQK